MCSRRTDKSTTRRLCVPYTRAPRICSRRLKTLLRRGPTTPPLLRGSILEASSTFQKYLPRIIISTRVLHFGNARPGRPERQRAQARRSSTPASTSPHRDPSRLNSTPQDPFVSISIVLLFPIPFIPSHSGSNTTQARPNLPSLPLGAQIPFSPLSSTPLLIASTPFSFQTVLRRLRRCFKLCTFYFLVFTSVVYRNV
jgi:hypothetical protein